MTEPGYADAAPQTPPTQPGDGLQASAPATTKRNGLLIGLVGGGALLVLLVVAGIVWFAVQTAAHAPAAAVSPYLSALVKGDAATAVKVGRIQSDSPTLTDSAYRATKDRITSYKVVGVHTSGKASTVVVRYEQAGETHKESFQVTSDGTDQLFFTRWRLAPITLPVVKVSIDAPRSASTSVNGTHLDTGDDGEVALDVFPGRYQVSLAGTHTYQAQSHTVTVTSLAAGTASTRSVGLAATLTSAGMKSADAAVNAWVAACIAQQTIQPTGCSFGLIDDYPDVHLSNQKWTLVTAPTFAIGPWDGSGWTVITTKLGAASYTADATTDDGGYGTLSSEQPVGVAVEGHITGFGADGSATFTSVDWSGKASLPTA